VAIDTVVLSTQHAPELGLADLRELVVEEIIRPCLADHPLEGCRILVNPAGTFHQGGPIADAGLTGRKIIVDSYGGFARHGGGAFSGKDPTKVDRSAAYAARHLAGSLLEAHGLSACEVRLSYAIGVAEPVAVHVDIAGRDGGALGLEAGSILRALTPGAIIARLALREQRYRTSAAFGHFGRPEFPWERFSPDLRADEAASGRRRGGEVAP
jgi:S-adenosylmethionine synthetase